MSKFSRAYGAIYTYILRRRQEHFGVLSLLNTVFPLENEQSDPKTGNFSGRRRRPDPKIVQILDLRAPDFLERGGIFAKGG